MSKKILIIDDDADLVKVFALRLKSAGFETDSAAQAEEGLRKCQESPPSVVLLDIQMPNMSGTEIAKKLREDEKTRNIPIIFMTGKVDLEKENIPRDAKTDVIIKPCDFTELVDKANKLAA